MTEPKAPHWLTLTTEITPTWEQLKERFGGDKIDAICTGRWYELAHAAMATALNLAIDQTEATPRKRRRMGPPMLAVMFNVLPLIFMFGYVRGKEESETVNTDNCQHCGCVVLPGESVCGACGAPIERESNANPS